MRSILFSIGDFHIYGYGFMIALGILLCLLLGTYRAKKYGMNPEAILDIAIYGVLAGFLGAKLLYVIVEFPAFLKDPLAVLGSEGFVVYGGIFLGAMAGVVYCRIKKLKFFDYFDLLAPSISLAQAVGRIGCFLAGCCYGRETDSCIGVVFPADSLAPAGVKVIPTQLISSAGDFLIMAILLICYKKRKYSGDIGALYMMLYAVGRFCVEFLRNDARGGFWGLSTSQWISFLIAAGAVALFIRNRKAGPIEATPSEEAEEKKED